VTDNELIQLFLPIINAGLIADGYTGVSVIQSNQPTQQGLNTNPTVYFYKVNNKRYGFLGRYDKWDTVNSVMVHTEDQYYETTFQVSALVLQNVYNTNSYTASDLVNDVASIIQSDNTLNILNNAGVGILRVTDIANPYFVDDRDQFEASPSFDFTLTYRQTRVTTDPVVQSVKLNINRV
jgi:hypothetical protein